MCRSLSMPVMLAFFLAACLAAGPAAAWWIPDGTAVSAPATDQMLSEAASDGAGGAIFVWKDKRNGNDDVYAQRLDASGAPLWATDGIPVCTEPHQQWDPAIVSDGCGGAVVVWSDTRSGYSNVYAQRIDAAGSMLWTADGVPLCTAIGGQNLLRIVSDDAGGAVVAWIDERNGHDDVFARRVNANGTALWTEDGVSLCTSSYIAEHLAIAGDGSGGAIVAWTDHRTTETSIYAQRIDADGDVRWATNGWPLCSSSAAMKLPAVVSDGTGGGIFVWLDHRNGNDDVYAQRVTASGGPAWVFSGIPVCTQISVQAWPTLVADGSGGAYCAWGDYRNGSYDIYAQWLSSAGDMLWSTDGQPVCTASNSQTTPQIISDGGGGAVVSWSDNRDGNYDIYAQRLDGLVTCLWTPDGVALCSGFGDKMYPAIAADGSGGAIATWTDQRTGEDDVYAQAVDGGGRVGFLAPAIHSARDVPGDQGGLVELTWDAARSDRFRDGEVVRYSLWRALDSAKAAGAAWPDDLARVDLDAPAPVVRVERTAARTWYWELVDTVDALNMTGYGRPVATLFDSTAVCSRYHYFQVVAHTETPSIFWASAPDSGYSVDNLPPDTPKSLTGRWLVDATALHWLPNVEPDLALYRLHRGDAEDFTPDASNLAVAKADTGWVDPVPGIHYYKLCAEDEHGNLSPYASLTPQQTTGSPAAAALRLLAVSPNPFNPRTTIRFELPRTGSVRVDVYDLEGRRVRSLFAGRLAAGMREIDWDGRDDRGAALGSGAYLCRLEFAGATAVRRMTLVR